MIRWTYDAKRQALCVMYDTPEEASAIEEWRERWRKEYGPMKKTVVPVGEDKVARALLWRLKGPEFLTTESKPRPTPRPQKREEEPSGPPWIPQLIFGIGEDLNRTPRWLDPSKLPGSAWGKIERTLLVARAYHA